MKPLNWLILMMFFLSTLLLTLTMFFFNFKNMSSLIIPPKINFNKNFKYKW